MVGASCIEAMHVTNRQDFLFGGGQSAEEMVEQGSSPYSKSKVSKGVNGVKWQTLGEQDHELAERHF